LKKLGVEEVDCVILDLSPEDEKELNIRLNANSGSWDMELLEDWDKQDLEEWGLELDLTDESTQKKLENESTDDKGSVNIIVTVEEKDMIIVINELEKIKFITNISIDE